MGGSNKMGITIGKSTQREVQIKTTLQEKKPKAFAKIQKFPQRLEDHESIALVQLQYDYRCNMACTHCAIEKFRDNRKPKKFNVEEIKKVADQIDQIGLASICISGGEPLIFPDLEDIIKAIGPERFVLSIDTNGLKLDEAKIKWLVEKGVDRIHLSLDGLEENHNKFRKVKENSWKHNVDILQYCKQYGLGVVINIVATKSLVKSKEMEKQLEFIQQFDFHASMIYAKPVGTFEEAKNEILNQEDLDYLETLTKKYNCSTHLTMNNGIEMGCLCFKRHFSITAYGDVLPCPWIPISMGNVFEEDLKTILDRGLNNKWFSFDNKYTCHSGNCDSEFYQKIIPQIEQFDEYPVNWKKINWN
jgi:MoaA/NifB/PqqE/SkfB family radical SAM enzyme